jgi:rhodanese-related sulfurtransferase
MRKKLFLTVLIVLFFVSIANAKKVSTCYSAEHPMPKVAKTITSIEAYHMLVTQPDTYLIDVRTRAEYQLVGHACYKKNGMMEMAYNIPIKFWTGKVGKKNKYSKALNKNFLKDVMKKFKKTDTLIIMCRSGDRSVTAANILTDAGFKKVYNVIYGFEGKPLQYGRDKAEKKLMKKYAPFYNYKGRLNGWRSYGLCQTYKMDPDFMYPADFE